MAISLSRKAKMATLQPPDWHMGCRFSRDRMEICVLTGRVRNLEATILLLFFFTLYNGIIANHEEKLNSEPSFQNRCFHIRRNII